jgi:RHH-type proline utilization regulon transcriptional repressor/proline dehydrogenase/delta 1-pyrroline-5-carboxylate dehydrogenase
VPYRDLEPAVTHIGREIQEQVRAHRGIRERAEQRLLDVAIAEPAARARLFQLVDAFPALRDSEDVATHISGYLDHEDVRPGIRRAVRVARLVPGGDRASATMARHGIMHMASRFIAGTDAATAQPTFYEVWADGMGVIVDLRGEKTITQPDADRYAARLAQVVATLTQRVPGRDPGRPMGRRSIAIKPTALAPRLHPLTAEAGLDEARQRLRPILRTAAEAGLLVWFDMEQSEVKDLTLALFRSLVAEPSLAGLRAGIVIQAYLRESHADVQDLLHWCAEGSHPIDVRLVKGAYWDAETVTARAHGWPVPVYEHKGDTDANYERCTRLLLEAQARGTAPVRPSFASHNVRSIAHAVAAADDLGLARRDLGFQMLFGMEGGLARAVRSLGPQVDIYAPVGALVPGMSYLVRRLLENSSNESFVRQSGQVTDDDVLLAPPESGEVAA